MKVRLYAQPDQTHTRKTKICIKAKKRRNLAKKTETLLDFLIYSNWIAVRVSSTIAVKMYKKCKKREKKVVNCMVLQKIMTINLIKKNLLRSWYCQQFQISERRCKMVIIVLQQQHIVLKNRNSLKLDKRIRLKKCILKSLLHTQTASWLVNSRSPLQIRYA